MSSWLSWSAAPSVGRSSPHSLVIETIQVREGRWTPRRPGREGNAGPDGGGFGLGHAGYLRHDGRGGDRGGTAPAVDPQRRKEVQRGVMRLGRVIRSRAVRATDRDRALRAPTTSPDLRETLPQGRRGSRSEQVPARALLHPNYGAVSWIGRYPPNQQDASRTVAVQMFMFDTKGPESEASAIVQPGLANLGTTLWYLAPTKEYPN